MLYSIYNRYNQNDLVFSKRASDDWIQNVLIPSSEARLDSTKGHEARLDNTKGHEARLDNIKGHEARLDNTKGHLPSV